MRGKSWVLALFCALVVLGLTVPTIPAQDAELIEKVQSALKERGLNPGPIDGIMGPKTIKALVKFQIQNDIQVSGEMDQQTLNRLGIRGGVLDRASDVVRTAGKKVRGATTTAADATTRGARATVSATTTGARSTAKRVTKGAKATRTGATIGAKEVASGVTTGARATATVGEVAASGAATGARTAATVGKATASGAARGGKAVTAGVSRGAKAAISWLPGNKGGDLADRVKARLKRDLNSTAEDVWVRTDGKNVYLIFSGGTQAEWNRAVATARKVDGVKNVFIRLPE